MGFHQCSSKFVAINTRDSIQTVRAAFFKPVLVDFVPGEHLLGWAIYNVYLHIHNYIHITGYCFGIVDPGAQCSGTVTHMRIVPWRTAEGLFPREVGVALMSN